MPRYVYRDLNGKITPVMVGSTPFSGTPEDCSLPFHETILRAYSRLENDGKMQGAYASKSEIKRIHEHAAARDAAGLAPQP